MGLAEQQHVLARLYTDATFRERFLADPQGASAELGLAPEDIQRLIHLPSAQVRFLARSLSRKRLGEVGKLLPTTRQVLGHRFAALFQPFAERATSAGPKKHREDALAFARFLEQLGRRDGSSPAWLADVIHYESAWLTMSDPSRRWLLRCFRYSAAEVLRATAQGASISSPRGLVIAFWFRARRSGPLRHMAWSLSRFFPRSRLAPSREGSVF